MNGPAIFFWLLGAYMGARYMYSTGGPKPEFSLIYLLILATWPFWVGAWVVSDVWRMRP